jgi:hypothetical protein
LLDHISFCDSDLKQRFFEIRQIERKFQDLQRQTNEKKFNNEDLLLKFPLERLKIEWSNVKKHFVCCPNSKNKIYDSLFSLLLVQMKFFSSLNRSFEKQIYFEASFQK